MKLDTEALASHIVKVRQARERGAVIPAFAFDGRQFMLKSGTVLSLQAWYTLTPKEVEAVTGHSYNGISAHATPLVGSRNVKLSQSFVGTHEAEVEKAATITVQRNGSVIKLLDAAGTVLSEYHREKTLKTHGEYSWLRQELVTA